jgi:hypothetical protein
VITEYRAVLDVCRSQLHPHPPRRRRCRCGADRCGADRGRADGGADRACARARGSPRRRRRRGDARGCPAGSSWLLASRASRPSSRRRCPPQRTHGRERPGAAAGGCPAPGEGHAQAPEDADAGQDVAGSGGDARTGDRLDTPGARAGSPDVAARSDPARQRPASRPDAHVARQRPPRGPAPQEHPARGADRARHPPPRQPARPSARPRTEVASAAGPRPRRRCRTAAPHARRRGQRPRARSLVGCQNTSNEIDVLLGG